MSTVKHPSCNHDLETPHAVCGVCKLAACDECSSDWVVCSGCGGGICGTCSPSARFRMVYNKTAREFLCLGCAKQQDEARAKLNDFLYYGIARSSLALLNKLNELAERAAADEHSITDRFSRKYPEQAGAYSAALSNVEIQARITAKYSTVAAEATVDAFAGEDAWLADVISELEDAIRTAKEAL